MRMLSAFAISIVLASMASSQQPSAGKASAPAMPTDLFKAKVTAEWDAFKKKDRQAYSDLLADDFVAVEDDNQGMRNKAKAVAEIDGSVVRDYHLFALNVVSLNANAALVTYEITLDFPTTAQVRFKRVLVSEVWLRRNGQWKERYYQETHVR